MGLHFVLGYVIQPTDGSHYVRLFADAQFYGCRRSNSTRQGILLLIQYFSTASDIPTL